MRPPYPLSLTNRPDGIYLTAVSAESIQTPRGPMDYSRALGSRLIAIGGVDIEEAKRRMTTLISTDKDIWPTFVLPSFLIIPEFLHVLEIVPDMEQGSYRVEDATGRRREVVLKPGNLIRKNYETFPGKSNHLRGADRERRTRAAQEEMFIGE